MSTAYRDENSVPTLIASANTDGFTPVRVYADPVTHRLLVDMVSSQPGFQQPTGTVNGVNATFVWTTAPNAIVVDQGRVMQKTSSDGTVNWTGTTTTVLAVAPIFDIFSVA